jgi:hypothetical protein
MIDVVSREVLRELVQTQRQRCVSMYLLTHRAGPEAAQDPIRLKNLLAKARAELVCSGLRGPEADELLAPASGLRGSGQFWAELSDGLALFLTDGGMRTFRLPNSVEELVVVAERFHLKPLLAVVATGEVFYVLALSQGKVRLLQGGRFGISELELGDVPQSLAEALWFDDRERQLQHHGAGRVGRGRVTATFHGHAMDKDALEEDLLRFLGAVDRGVREIIGDRRAPLVLAGVGYLLPLYRQVSSHQIIVEGGIGGNPEQLTPDELHALAWPLVEPLFTEDRRNAAEAFLAGTGPTVSTVEEAVVAAYQGRVGSIFVPVGCHRWGSFDPPSMTVDEREERQPGDHDLLDVAAAFTLINGGDVFAVEPSALPSSDPIAAVLRF